MAAPPSMTVRSLRAYVERIEGYQNAVNGPLWFRGAGKATYDLGPSIYRHKPPKLAPAWAKLELQLIEMFKQRSLIYGTRPLADRWERLFFMQHYGVPTRLLDWTESPFIAFFFAVTSASKEWRGGVASFPADAAVWVLDPVAWNRWSLRHLTYNESILSVGDDPLKGYTWRPDYQNMNTYPACMFGIHNSQRIINQRGVFSVFGQGTEPMEVAYDHGGFPANCLRRIRLPRSLISDFRRAIVAWGITDSVVYPDLPGLALEIRRFHGFEV